MTYLADLSDYNYFREFMRPCTKAIGWLDSRHGFDNSGCSDEALDALWAYCKVSVGQLRGYHQCDLCGGDEFVVESWGGESLLLGTSEIRVFGAAGTIYAAPTMIFHYVRRHFYRPPGEFLNCLSNGPSPPSEEYFNRLRNAGLSWAPTSTVPLGQKTIVLRDP